MTKHHPTLPRDHAPKNLRALFGRIEHVEVVDVQPDFEEEQAGKPRGRE